MALRRPRLVDRTLHLDRLDRQTRAGPLLAPHLLHRVRVGETVGEHRNRRPRLHVPHELEEGRLVGRGVEVADEAVGPREPRAGLRHAERHGLLRALESRRLDAETVPPGVRRIERRDPHAVPFRRREADHLAVVAEAVDVLRRRADRVHLAEVVRLRDDRRRLGTVRDGRVQRQVGRLQVLLHQERRRVMGGACVVKPVRHPVRRQLAAEGKLDSQQVADRVLVLDAVEPPQHAPPLGGPRRGGRLGDPRRQPFGQLLHLRVGRTRLPLRRHLARLEPINDRRPARHRRRVGEVGLEKIEPQLAVGLLAPMTFVAVLRQQRTESRFKGRRSNRGDGLGRRSGDGGLREKSRGAGPQSECGARSDHLRSPVRGTPVIVAERQADRNAAVRMSFQSFWINGFDAGAFPAMRFVTPLISASTTTNGAALRVPGSSWRSMSSQRPARRCEGQCARTVCVRHRPSTTEGTKDTETD